MSETYKILAQSRPTAATLTDVYTAPALTNTVISSIIVSNTTSSSDTFRISLSINGAADATVQYIYYNISLSRESTFSAVLGITIDASDVIRCYSTNGRLNFHIFGAEVV